jgi:hypothetical protein
MPNLEQHAVSLWLAELLPDVNANQWPPAFRALETAADHAKRLKTLGDVLDRLASKEPQPLSAVLTEATLRGDLRAVLAQLGAARLMRLLHWLAQRDMPEPRGMIAALVAGDDAEGNALRAAIAAVTRRALFARIFAPERIVALAAACHTAFSGPA